DGGGGPRQGALRCGPRPAAPQLPRGVARRPGVRGEGRPRRLPGPRGPPGRAAGAPEGRGGPRGVGGVWRALGKGKRGLKEQRGEVEEHYRSFEAATSALKEHGGVLAPNLRHSISALLWNLGWHAANAVGGMLDEAPDEEEEEESGEEGEGDGDDAAGEEDEEDEDDLDKRFGDDYPGSSDDHVDDLRSALNAFRECFWDAKPWRGVSLSLASLDEAGACAELEAIGAVPGLFGEPGLNAVRLVVGGRSGERDALGAVARSALLRARQLSLQVVLELPAVPGKEHEAWLREAAASAAEAGCVRGVALPRLAA
ncbi:unnamed protein product, partial [Prorocentrum cordatum]